MNAPGGPAARLALVSPRILPACLVLISLTGCAAWREPVCPPGAEPMTVSTLYFGSDSPRGVVTLSQWQAFVDEEVTPRFPAGLTHWTASGQWRDRAGEIVREDSRVLTILHDSPQSERTLSHIAARYKALFLQEAVLTVRSDVCVSF